MLALPQLADGLVVLVRGDVQRKEGVVRSLVRSANGVELRQYPVARVAIDIGLEDKA